MSVQCLRRRPPRRTTRNTLGFVLRPDRRWHGQTLRPVSMTLNDNTIRSQALVRNIWGDHATTFHFCVETPDWQLHCERTRPNSASGQAWTVAASGWIVRTSLSSNSAWPNAGVLVMADVDQFRHPRCRPNRGDALVPQSGRCPEWWLDGTLKSNGSVSRSATLSMLDYVIRHNDDDD